MAIDTIIPVISHLYLGFNGIISCIARVVDFIENVYHIRVWKALSKGTNFSDGRHYTRPKVHEFSHNFGLHKDFIERWLNAMKVAIKTAVATKSTATRVLAGELFNLVTGFSTGCRLSPGNPGSWIIRCLIESYYAHQLVAFFILCVSHQ